MLFRVIFGCCGITFGFVFRHMPLGMATALFQSSVIFITLLSPIFLGERVGLYRWSAVLTGLSGVLIITNPFSGDSIVVFSLWHRALAGAVLSLLLRQLARVMLPHRLQYGTIFWDLRLKRNCADTARAVIFNQSSSYI